MKEYSYFTATGQIYHMKNMRIAVRFVVVIFWTSFLTDKAGIFSSTVSLS